MAFKPLLPNIASKAIWKESIDLSIIHHHHHSNIQWIFVSFFSEWTLAITSIDKPTATNAGAKLTIRSTITSFFSMFYLATIFILSIESLSATISEREEITSLKYYGENLQKPSKSLRRALMAGERPDWLSDVPDDRKINSLSLPGTHETCAQYGGPACACQDLTLMEQLQAGVRIFDIRCRHVNDVFMIHHGIIYQHLSFGTGVRDVMIEFLKEHPREFIYMMDSSDSFWHGTASSKAPEPP